MCFVINRWRKFKVTTAYLLVTSKLNTVAKLFSYLKQFKPKAEKTGRDYWKTPIEFIQNKDKPNDCEDFSIFAVDVLVRIIKIYGARLIIHTGYDKSRWKGTRCHAIAVFPYKGKLAVFNFNKLYTGLSSYEGAGHITFPDGLKLQMVINWRGKVLSKKGWKLFGTF